MRPEDCPHERFAATVAVGRILDVGKFVADVKVNCLDCGVAMRFKGVPAGLSYEQPMCSIDSEELHAPIEPAIEAELQTRATYHVTKAPTRN